MERLTTTWIDDDQLELVLALLMPQNRLIMQLAIHTGLRIGDILALRSDQLKPRVTVREQKTGKSHRISIPAKLLRAIQAQAGEVWAFPGRDPDRPKTRQAVWADVKRAAAAMRISANVGPHTMRKIYAVRKLAASGGNLAAVQQALNHSDMAVTMIYAMADHLTQQRRGEPGRRRGHPR